MFTDTCCWYIKKLTLYERWGFIRMTVSQGRTLSYKYIVHIYISCTILYQLIPIAVINYYQLIPNNSESRFSFFKLIKFPFTKYHSQVIIEIMKQLFNYYIIIHTVLIFKCLFSKVSGVPVVYLNLFQMQHHTLNSKR